MIKRIKETWHRKRIRAIYKQLENLTRVTYPIPAGMAVAIIGTCSKYHRTGMTDMCAALDWLMQEGKVVKDKGDGLLPDRFYEKSHEQQMKEYQDYISKVSCADA